MKNVALIKGNSRYDNILKSLNLIKEEIKPKKTIIIKPNFVSATIQLAATHVDCIKAILDFFKDKKVIIAEASAHNTKRAFKNFNYLQLKDLYNIELIDLNSGPYTTFELPKQKLILNNPTYPHNITSLIKKLLPRKLRISNLLLDKNNYVISATPLKTHDSVIATLSIKNITMGSIQNHIPRLGKALMHQGVKELNQNIFELYKKLHIDLAVIDGFEAMEGNGPSYGDLVSTKCAIASTDALAADRVALEVMKIPSDYIGYLNYCYKEKLGEYDLNKINIMGNKISDCQKEFKLHDSYKKQLEWKK